MVGGVVGITFVVRGMIIKEKSEVGMVEQSMHLFGDDDIRCICG